MGKNLNLFKTMSIFQSKKRIVFQFLVLTLTLASFFFLVSDVAIAGEKDFTFNLTADFTGSTYVGIRITGLVDKSVDPNNTEWCIPADATMEIVRDSDSAVLNTTTAGETKGSDVSCASDEFWTDGTVVLESGQDYSINISWTDAVAGCSDASVGDECGGGYVFYNKDGLVLIAAHESTKYTSKQWGYYGTEIGGDAQSTGIGAGSSATQAWMDYHNSLDPGSQESDRAALLCDSLEYEGYSDWFLPSKDELNEIYINLHDIATPIGGFAGDFYWSSSEFNANLAWDQNFVNADLNFKNYGVRVRCARAD
jgi:hypothetical protein